MLLVSLANLVLNLLFEPSPWWSMWPIAIYAFGWALMVPVVTLMVLDLFPSGAAWRRRCRPSSAAPPRRWWPA